MKNENYAPENNDAAAKKEAARRRMMGLFARNRINDDMRHDLVYAWTNGRTSSSSKLELSEMLDLCWKLQNNFDAPATALYVELECKKLRSIVLKLATDVGIKEPADFAKFNRFMKDHSILKKELHKYKINELHDLVGQFRAIERNQNRSAQNPGTKAWYQSVGIPVPSAQ